MPLKHKEETYLWDDESGEPFPMTIEECDARLEAANERRHQENLDMQARLEEVEVLVEKGEMLVIRLQTLVDAASVDKKMMDETWREIDEVKAKARELLAANYAALEKSSDPRFTR